MPGARLLRSAITYGVFPLTFCGAMWAAHTGVSMGHAVPAVLAVVAGTVAFVVTVCERINPHYEAWNRSREDVGTDAMHAAVSMVLVPQLLELVLQASLLGVAVGLSDRLGHALWPSHWNVFAQLGLAMLVSQLGEYWVHRRMHESPLLWRLHATHHSPERLYWLNAARFHPLDTAISFSVSLAPLLALGAGPEVLLLVSVWVAVHGMFQHCNIRLRLGPLNYIFSMAELHRWHHSLKLEEANANYGNNIILWDVVFGTMYYPKDREASEHIGLLDLPRFPQRYFGQILSPFAWSRITASDA